MTQPPSLSSSSEDPDGTEGSTPLLAAADDGDSEGKAVGVGAPPSAAARRKSSTISTGFWSGFSAP